MNEIVGLILVLLLATSGYAAGRLHGQFSYRLGYRFGYRQGYFDGDRASWSRRRREMQAVVASILTAPGQAAGEERRTAVAGTILGGTMYASDTIAEEDDESEPLTDAVAS